MARLKFGAFLAPHHPIGEHPMLQFRRDLDFVEQIDALGFDEFWCGEHHSSGWEMIASPEMFLAAAGERTKRIRLGTGVVSLPYHHPFNVAQRMVQLDYMTGGRAIFGSGPGALASDAHTLNIDPMSGAAIASFVERAVGSGVVSPGANRKAIRQQTEPLEAFRRYLTTYAFEQAFCHLSDQLIVNLEKHWNAKQRKL